MSLLQRCRRAWMAFINEPAAPVPRPWDQATDEDVYYCYRLLLNREPDAGGWEKHRETAASRNIGLQTMVGEFLMSTEFRLLRSARISSWSKPKLITVNGLQLYVGPPDSLVVRALENGSLEGYILVQLERLLQPGMTMVDVGANLGYLSVVAARKVGPAGRVLAFEPNQFNCTLIYMNAQANNVSNIEVFPFAAGASNGTALYQDLIGNGRVIGSVDLLDHVTANDLDHITAMSAVRTVTLDYALASEPRIDMLKIDVEGGEYLVFKGARETLRKHRPVVLSELSIDGLRAVSGVSAEDYLKLIIDMDYEIATMDEDSDLVACGQDVGAIIARHHASRTNHIDILATPR